MTEPAIAAETYTRWRTTVLASVTESVKTSVVVGQAEIPARTTSEPLIDEDESPHGALQGATR